MEKTIGMREIRKKIYSMILPITMENILQTMAGLVTAGMMGRIDTIAVGAQGLSVRITQIVFAFFKGITTGMTVFVAQAYGAGDFDKIRKVVKHTLFSTLILVIVCQQIIFWNASGLLAIFNPTQNLADAALVYLRIVSWGLPFATVMAVVAGTLQGMGNAKTPMMIAVMVNIFNIMIGYILIFGGFGISPQGLQGAAYALVIAQLMGALIGLYMLFNKKGVLGPFFRSSFKIDFRQIFSIFKVGIPTSLESVFWQIAAIILTVIMLTFGETAFAAYQLGLQAESISYMPALGFGVAATTFIGHSLGARDKVMGRLYLKELVKGSLIVTIVTASVLIFLPGAVMGLLTYDPEVIRLGAIYLFLMGLVQIPQNISGVLNGALRGAGYTRVPMIVAGVGLWCIRIPGSWVLTHFFNYGIEIIWIVMCVDLVFRFILSLTLYRTRNIYERETVYQEKSSFKLTSQR